MQNLLLYLGFATLMAYELNAMSQADWRRLFILKSLGSAHAVDAGGEGGCIALFCLSLWQLAV